jgi:hypothetical protein
MKEDIIKMAREAGFEFTSTGHLNLSGADWHTEECVQEYLERFAALVADRCAEIAYEAEPFHSADLIREAFGVKK